MKIKVQIPGGDRRRTNSPHPGPSSTTREELKVLQIFSTPNPPYVPQLLGHAILSQPAKGPLPGGYVTYTAITVMPGLPLFNQNYWDKPAAEREEILSKFLTALRGVYALGIEPIDCRLRNVMWERESGTCSIIDFELWRETEGKEVGDETKELQRWGLARRPPSKAWWAEWNTQGR